MTPEEHQLVAGLFDRMRNYRLPEKDGEAEALINENVRAVPDAPYMLVQSVLIQEQALEQADARIRALEEQVRALEAQQRPSGAGSFLGGLFGSRAAPEPTRGPSVPTIGARATPPLYAGGQGGQAGQPGGPQGQAPWQSAPPPGQAGQAGGGGFLRTAMATAAGVAGGMLLAGAIQNMMNPAHAHTGNTNINTSATGSGETQPAPASAGDTGRTEAAPDASNQVVDEDSSWFGGDSGGDFGGDFDL
jgi:hypothetical protein